MRGPIRIIWARSLVLFLLALWQWRAWTGALDVGTLPTPSSVADAVWSLASSGDLSLHVMASLRRVLTGFVLGTGIALAVATVALLVPAMAPPVRRLTDVLRPIPPLAWIPLAILWFGIGGRAPVFIVLIGCVFPILTATIDSVAGVDRRYVDTARTLGATHRMVVFRVVYPAALPGILSGMRVGLGVAWTSVIAAELVVGQEGLGYLINSNRLLLRSDVVVGGMVVIGVVGLLMITVFEFIERQLAKRRGDVVSVGSMFSWNDDV